MAAPPLEEKTDSKRLGVDYGLKQRSGGPRLCENLSLCPYPLPLLPLAPILIDMRCPFCGEDDDKVIDSRATDAGKAIRRRRECVRCHRRFTTKEHVEESTRLIVIKRDGSRVPYDRQKVLVGVQRALYKRPVPAEAHERLVEEVEEELYRGHEREVASVEIGKAIAHRLKTLDQVAYVRFASVYKQFRDLGDLLEEVRDVFGGERESPSQGRLF